MTAERHLPSNGPWPGVAEVLDRAPSWDGILAHRLGPVAMFHRGGVGATTPEEGREELFRMAKVAAAQRVLRAVVNAIDQDVVLFKGLALASRYPRLELRHFSDIDLLVADPERAHAALLAAGFQPWGQHDRDHYAGLQHLQPLAHPAVDTIPVEIHEHVSWVPWSAPPDSGDIIRASQPASVGVDGIREPDPAHHALVVVSHSAGEMPLRCIGDLLDLDLLSREASAHELSRAADAWSARRLWALYREAADAVLYGAKPTPMLRRWAPSLFDVREPTVAERHLRNLISPIWTRNVRDIPRGLARSIADDLRPADGETWSEKVVRLRAGGRNWRRTLSEHAGEIGVSGARPQHRRRTGEERVTLPPREDADGRP